MAKKKVQHNLWGTPGHIVDACVRELARGSFFAGVRRHFLEPACGAGAWTAGLARHSFKAKDLKAIDNSPEMCRQHHQNFPEVRCLVVDFLQWAKETNQNRFIGIGNPPFGEGIEVTFIMAMKPICCRFAMLMPMGMLEPALKRPPGLYEYLTTIYPLRRIRFLNLMTGKPEGAGSRPVGLFVYDMERKIARCQAVVDYSIQQYLDEQERIAKGGSVGKAQ